LATYIIYFLIFKQEEDGNFYLEIRDNGYILSDFAANLITHLHDFFMSDEYFQQICRDNDIGYSTTRSKDGDMNVTYIMFPAPQEEIANSNVEQL